MFIKTEQEMGIIFKQTLQRKYIDVKQAQEDAQHDY